MENFIPITSISDFCFCPYSIYLHNIFKEVDDSLYQAEPQIKGKMAHEAIDKKEYGNKDDDIQSLNVLSEKYKLVGVIDLYRSKSKELVEFKTNTRVIGKEKLYQIWAQMLCMREMGYEVRKLTIHDLINDKDIPIQEPTAQEMREFETLLDNYKMYDPMNSPIETSANKCSHCIYSKLCDKNPIDNVYD